MTNRQRILIVDDERGQRELLGGYLKHLGYEIFEAGDGEEAIEVARHKAPDLVLLDQRMPKLGGADAIRALHESMPDLDIVVVTAFGTVEQAVEALHLGAVDYLTKPVDLDRLQVVVRKALERRTLLRENRDLRQKLAGGPRMQGIITGSGVMEELLGTVARAAPTEATVLITGESGTGKELIARAIHSASPRAEGPFVAVHCAALAESLLESELFGHAKGAFTGAHQNREGRFESASGGTLFLDEIAEIPLPVQVKLLRVLQERVVERVGSNAPIPLDVRLIAASNQDLAEEIRARRFRDDLFYRLAVIRLYLPPLRRRREDVPLLVQHFLDKHRAAGTQEIKEVSREFMDALQRYEFPGNVRELENLVHSAIVLSRGELLTTDDLPTSVRDLAEEEGHTFERFEGSLPQQIEALERRLIAEALAQTDGVQYRAAEGLGISERTLRYKMEKYAMK